MSAGGALGDRPAEGSTSKTICYANTGSVGKTLAEGSLPDGSGVDRIQPLLFEVNTDRGSPPAPPGPLTN